MQKPRVIIAGSKRTPIPGRKNLSKAQSKPDPNEVIEVTISLRRKTQVPKWVTHTGVLSKEQLASDYGTSAADFIAVKKFVESYHLKVTEESPLTCTVKVSGTISNLEKAFETELKHVTVDGKVYRERRGHLSIPENVSSIIEGVFGLDNRKQANPRFRHSVGPLVGHSFSPLDVAQLYNFPAADGTGQTIAIIELGGGFVTADLNTYFASLGLKAPQVTAVLVDGGKNLPVPADPHDPDAEVMLDIEVAGAVAPKAAIKVYFAPNTDKGFLDAVNKAIQDMPTVISISWGGPESSWTNSVMLAFDKSFQTAASLSIPVTVASGDNGSTDGTSALMVDFPASAPHALACGGTHLEGGGTTITTEIVWNSNGGATGGGVSSTFAKPAYQNSVNVPTLANGKGGRGVPDICGDAAPETGYKVRCDGKNVVIGGTSAVAPLWAGLIARLAQKTGSRVPFLNPILYANPAAFRDITAGKNDIGGGGGKYGAAAGWDACTGLGSPKGAAILTALLGHGGTSTPPVTIHTTPPVTKHTTPPVTIHSTPPVTKHTTPPVTKHTTPPVTKHTTPPVTKHTTPPVTKHTTPPVTKHTTPPVTKHTTPPVTKHTTPPVTKHTTPPVTGSGSTEGSAFYNQWYQAPPSYEPAPVIHAQPAPQPAASSGVPATLAAMGTGGGGGGTDIVALVATVATVASTAITAITAIVGISANSKK